ncbi:unnamed protein product, partial [Meganyctiphanes norvegica]
MDKVSSWYGSSWIPTYAQHEAGGWLSQFGLLTWGLLVCCVAALIPVLYRRWKVVSTVECIPGPFAWPLIGNAPQFNVSPRELFKTMVSMCCYEEGLSLFWLPTAPNVFIYKANLVEILLSSSKHIEKAFGYKFTHPWLGLGLLTSGGTKWRSRRKLLTPTFHFKILEDFVEVFNRQSVKLVEKLHQESNGKPFDIFPYISRCALDIICETAMGVTLNAQDDTESKYLQAVSNMASMIQHRAARPWLHPDLLYRILGPYNERDQALKVLHGFTNNAIKFRKQERITMNTSGIETDSVEGKKRKLAFLDLLLEYSESGSQLSDEDIREEVDTFMFEGHDTTTSAINWTLYLLGLHPSIQEKVHEEIDGLFGDSDRPITSDDLVKLKYLESCIKESLRLYPSVPLHSRELKEDLQLDEY